MNAPPARRRLLETAVTVVAVLVAVAAPAAGGGPYPAEPTAGMLTYIFPARTFSFLQAPGTLPCSEKPSTVTMTASGTGPGTWTVDGSFSKQLTHPVGSSSWYQADIEIIVGSGGTYGTPSGVTTLSGVVALELTVSVIGDASQPNCAKDDVRCTFVGVFPLTWAFFVGSLPSATVGSTLVLNGDSRSPGGAALMLTYGNTTAPCDLGGHATLDALGLGLV